MRRPAALALVGLVLLLPACSSPPAGASEDEIAAWMDRSPDASAGDRNLGEATGRSTVADDAVPTPGEGISLEYPEPVRLDGVRLSCLGGGTLDFALSVATTAGTTEQTVAAVPCDEEPHEQAAPATGVTSVRVDASGADRDGAWNAVLLGDPA